MNLALKIEGVPGYWFLTWARTALVRTGDPIDVFSGHVWIVAGPWKRRGPAENALADYNEDVFQTRKT